MTDDDGGMVGKTKRNEGMRTPLSRLSCLVVVAGVCDLSTFSSYSS